MKKILLPLIIASLAFGQSIAAHRTQQQANLIARQFLEHPQAVQVGTSLYIYNNEEKPGFAIVSNSDLLRPVIGYSDSGTIDPDNMPETFRNWLHWVDEATQWLESHPECRLSESDMTTSTPVAPFMGNISWSQGYPYNALCPDNSVAGCIATAAAQCIYYHRYPSTGVGSHTNMNNASLSVNFSQTTYNFDLMFDYYTTKTNYTTAQLNEVAKLTYHCGVMADMKYSAEGSGTKMLSLRRGLVENLNYDPYCELIYRASHTLPEWQSYLMTELQASRPVIMAGAANNGTEGHCFLIDGINANGLYHVNWGWNGSYNGYYDITVLNPGGAGTGASFSEDGFCTDQSILIQLAPKGKLDNPVFHTSLTAAYGRFNISDGSVKLGSKVNFELKSVYNYSMNEVTGKFGIAFFQNGKIVKAIPYQYSAMTIKGYENGSVYGGNFNNLQATLPTNLASGNYQVYGCFIPSSGDFENECALIYCKATTPSFYNCTVSNGTATFSRKDRTVNIAISDWKFGESQMTTGTTQSITCSVTNKDSENTIVGKYFLQVTSPNNESEFIEAEDVLTLEPNANGSITFKKIFTQEGNWKSKLYFFYQNIDYDVNRSKVAIDGTNQTFYVEKDATTGADFTLLATPTVVLDPNSKDSLFIGSPASFSLKIKNTGDAYTGKLQMQLFKTTTSTTIFGSVTGEISIPANSEDTYSFSGTLEKISASFNPAASGTIFYAKAFFLFADEFKAFPVASGVTNRIKVKVFGGSHTGIESLQKEADNNEACFDLFGRRTSQSSSGLKILNKKIVIQK